MKKNSQSSNKIRMKLGSRSYDIHVGAGCISKLPKWLPKTDSPKKGFLIADEALTDARALTAAVLRKSGWEVNEIAVQAGESLKDAQSIYPIYGQLLKAGAKRDSHIFGLGGGTVGDAVGFVAGTFLRGIPWISLPTTVLAQVDSSIGGKTGINHELGKNLIGMVYQPKLVVCDTHFLDSLDERDMISGLGEVIKSALIFDSKFLAEIRSKSQKFLSRDPKVLQKFICKTIELKAKVVAKDEMDRLGLREVLNFGHTFGHALESATEYTMFRHGESVIWGMRFALCLSVVRKRLSPKVRLEIDETLRGFVVPKLPAYFGPSDFMEQMKQDKKVRQGKIHFVLLQRVGKTLSDSGVSEQDLIRAFEMLEASGGAY